MFKHKKLIYLICGILLLSALGAYAVESGNQAASSQTKIESPGGRAGAGVSSSTISAYEDRQAIDAYEQRNAQIDSREINYITLNHNNAALLYYQAFLLLPELDDNIYEKIRGVCDGNEPDKQVKIFLGKCLSSIKLFEEASQIPDCIWGLLSEEKIRSAFLNRNAVNLSYIVATDARILSADGHYRAALEQCLSLRQFSSHLSHISQLGPSSWEANGYALSTINFVLGEMPLDVDTLMWLRGRLSVVQMETELLDAYLNSILDTILKEIINSSQVYDEEAHLKAVEATQNLFGSFFAILDSEMSATQKLAEIQKIKITEKYPDNPLMNISADLLKEINSIMATDMAYEEMLTELKDVINKTVSNEQAAELIYNYFKRKLDINKIILSNVSQDHKITDIMIEIKKLSNEKSEAEKLADILMFPSPFGRSITFIFEIQIEQMSMVNITKAAVELYIILAKTGQLPKVLPDYLPKDPYTNQNFIYEITDDGFVLRCQGEEYLRRKNQFLEFKVKR
ncbi:MAG: hypothetical protein JW715_01665 [Sedimentisphaerales bacterium]|nr:hypothetical protein [Sedimentisphaerales bacterium]